MGARIESGHDDSSVASSPDVDWAEVRRVYELSEETVGAILDRFGLSRYQLEKRRVAEGWTTRPQIARPGMPKRPGSIGSQALAYRMNRLFTLGLAMLEKKVDEEGMTETNARTLTELARAQEITMRSTRNEKAAKAREKKNTDAGRDFRDDPAWLIAEIERKLGRLAEGNEARRTEGAVGEDRPGDRAASA
jgi:hypothetical protein